MDSKEIEPDAPAFTRKSERESICLLCFSIVRSDEFASIEVAENIHADVCLVKSGSFVRHAHL